jgi:hypothetical protein
MITVYDHNLRKFFDLRLWFSNKKCKTVIRKPTKAAADVYSKNDMLDKDTETLDNYEKAILKVTAAVFPIQAYVTQKQAMGHFIRKPKDMKIREYTDCLLKTNGYLKYFPTNPGLVGFYGLL